MSLSLVFVMTFCRSLPIGLVENLSRFTQVAEAIAFYAEANLDPIRTPRGVSNADDSIQDRSGLWFPIAVLRNARSGVP